MLNAGFSRLKNVPVALSAWATIKDKFPSAVLLAAGPGYELGGEGHKWAVHNGLDDRVDFVGSLASDEVPPWLAALDIFLHPSLEESFGMVLLEAMAAGVPVIAGQTSGAVPVVTGGNALLTDVASPGAIADSLTLMLNDEPLRHHLSESGRVWSQKFAVSESAKQFQTILSSLILGR
ncbi:glycosyltransferase family 4 protein [Arthrobacter globiformis]|uniref:glycosyltransferase family 4 protein n=1 Tax=Arthrobacter globiformis TaxID=1665 RepID=UPI001124DC08|nr:glycosyltransferase family 4 protein [Arthrobacter globiformis]